MRARTTAGPIATTTACRRNSHWPRNTAATARKLASAKSSSRQLRPFLLTGRPNDLKIYKGSQFPKAYQGGAFIAFHGSWNRAPGPQGGYNVVFQQSITDAIKIGVPQHKQHPGAMPPYVGVHLSDSELPAVAAYVWAIGHQKKR